MILSTTAFTTAVDNLMQFPKDNALRQVDIHEARGDFPADECDRLRAAIERRT